MLKSNNKIYAIGLMSGTSTDGVDVACIEINSKRKNIPNLLIKLKILKPIANMMNLILTVENSTKSNMNSNIYVRVFLNYRNKSLTNCGTHIRGNYRG